MIVKQEWSPWKLFYFSIVVIGVFIGVVYIIGIIDDGTYNTRSEYFEGDSRSKWVKGDVVRVIDSPVFGEVKKYLVDSTVLASEGKEEDFLHFAKIANIEDKVHVFRVGDKARVIEVYPFSLRLLPFNNSKKSFWVYDSERLKKIKRE